MHHAGSCHCGAIDFTVTMVSINVRCLPQLDLASLTILPYDGAGR